MAVTVAKGERCELAGVYRAKDCGKSKTMILDEPMMHRVPGGLVVECKLIQVEPRARNKVKVVIQNFSDHNVTLQPKGVLAECSVVDWNKPVPIHKNTSTSQEITSLMATLSAKSADPVILDFGNSPICEGLKTHITERGNGEASNAFSRHDLDVGRVSGVAHRIELTEHIPFKESTRGVSPADFEDLRKHLLDLLANPLIDDAETISMDERVANLISRAECAEFEKFDQEAIKTVQLQHLAYGETHTTQSGREEDLPEGNFSPVPAVEMLLCNDDVVPDSLIEPCPWPGQTVLPSMTPADWFLPFRTDKISEESVVVEGAVTLRMSKHNLGNNSIAEGCDKVAETEGPNMILNPCAPEFQLGVTSQENSDALVSDSLMNVKAEVELSQSSNDSHFENQLKEGCEGRTQQKVLSGLDDVNELLGHSEELPAGVSCSCCFKKVTKGQETSK
ncbi:uncharacterized protein LOC107119009 [Tachysurus ichikawai]